MLFNYKSRIVALISLPLVGIFMVGCGGGSSTDTSTTASTPTDLYSPALDYSVISTESLPIGATINIRPLNLMPIANDQMRWEYKITDASGSILGYGARHIVKPYTDLNGPTAELSESQPFNGESMYDTSYLEQKNDGLYVDYTKDRSIPTLTGVQIGFIREYAADTYAIGEKRTVVRQGVWDEDIDQDGKPEQFRLEYTQIFQGFESLQVPEHKQLTLTSNATAPSSIVTVAKFTNTYRLSITRSSDGKIEGLGTREDAYLAPGAGPIKFVRYLENLESMQVDGPRIWTITSLQNVSIAPEYVTSR